MAPGPHSPATGVDVLVVGGGILGMCTAYLAAREGKRVCVCRLSDDVEPFADTLRNQSWLQSGLRQITALAAQGFSPAQAVQFGREVRAAGRELHNELNLPLPGGFGILRVKDHAEGTALIKQSTKMGVSCTPINGNVAHNLLGALYDTSGLYLATPEVVFDEAQILEEIRGRLNAHVLLVHGPVTLAPNPKDPGGFTVAVQGNALSAPSTVIAAGVGTMPLLASLGTPRLDATQTPLAVIEQATLPHPRGRPRVFVDRVHKYSLVSHPPSSRLPNGATVLGAGFKKPFQFVPPGSRRVPQQDWNAFWNQLPPYLSMLRSQGRCTAGVEVGRQGQPDVLPYIEVLKPFIGLIAGIPGRATMAMRVASNIVSQLPTSTRPSSIPSQGTAWSSSIHMHHEPHYRGLHDV